MRERPRPRIDQRRQDRPQRQPHQSRLVHVVRMEQVVRGKMEVGFCDLELYRNISCE